MAKSREAAAFHLSWSGTDYPVYVDAPESGGGAAASGNKEEAAGGAWIGVLCLDGDDQFADLREMRDELAKTRALPPLLLAGIGYGVSYGKPGNMRARDYTPVAIPEAPQGGGADAFLGFLTGEVWAELARRWPLREDVRGIAGYSLGGLFALHALFKPRPFFNRVLAGSPSIWWGERAVLGAIAETQARDEALDARLFLSVGSRDSLSMTGDLEMLERQLADQPVGGLDVRSARFAGKNHFNAIKPAFREGLVELFGA